MRNNVFGSILALSIVAGTMAVATPASAMIWRNFADEGYVLSVKNNTTALGQAIVIQQDSGLPTQSWTEVYDGNGGFVFYSNIAPPPTNPPLVLGVQNGVMNNGTPLIDWLRDGHLDQSWAVNPMFSDANGHQCYLLVNEKNTREVASVSGGLMQQDRPVIIWNYLGHNDQIWCAY